MTADDVRAVQAKLNVPKTGVVDTATSDAVRSEQIKRNLPPTGALDVVLARVVLSGK
jgi:hypothetical protein